MCQGWDGVLFNEKGFIQTLALPGCFIKEDVKKMKLLFTEHLEVKPFDLCYLDVMCTHTRHFFLSPLCFSSISFLKLNLSRPPYSFGRFVASVKPSISCVKSAAY